MTRDDVWAASIALAAKAGIWLAVVAMTAFLSSFVRPADEDVPALTHEGGRFFSIWAHWDSVHFLAIAREGYENSFLNAPPAFYPLYPALIGAVGRVLGSQFVVAGALISLITGVLAAVAVLRIGRLRLDVETARYGVLLLVFCPMAFFFQAVYSESLFLLLAATAFLLAEHRRFAWAGLAAGACLLTRPVGIAVVVGILVLAFAAPHRGRSLASTVPGMAVAAAFPIWLALETGSPFSFLHAESAWGRQLAPAGPLTGLYDGARAGWASVLQLTVGTSEHPYWTSVEPGRTAVLNLINLGSALLFLALSVVAWKRVGAAYGAYSLIGVLIPLSFTSTTTVYPLLSMPRFGIVLFPLFLAAATVVPRPARALVLGTSALFLGVMSVGWALWIFVA